MGLNGIASIGKAVATPHSPALLWASPESAGHPPKVLALLILTRAA